jgi:hypothetical protein
MLIPTTILKGNSSANGPSRSLLNHVTSHNFAKKYCTILKHPSTAPVAATLEFGFWVMAV